MHTWLKYSLNAYGFHAPITCHLSEQLPKLFTNCLAWSIVCCVNVISSVPDLPAGFPQSDLHENSFGTFSMHVLMYSNIIVMWPNIVY
jgi:hypothetical protein